MKQARTWLRTAVLLVTAGGTTLHGQDLPEITSLSPSPTPAFLLLGVAPTDISRPNNPADFATELASSTHDFSQAPQNLAIEAAPYWLIRGERLTWRDDIERSRAESVKRTLAFSLASAEVGTDDAPRTAVAIGGRTLLFSGRVPQSAIEELEARERALAAISGSAADLLAPAMLEIDRQQQRQLRAALAGVDRTDPRRTVIEDSIAAVFNARRDRIREQIFASEGWTKIQEDLQALEKLVIVREGPMLELAAAGSWAFDDRDWETGSLDRLGVWATYSCEKCGTLTPAVRLTPMVVARYLRNVEGVDTDIFDAGARLALSGSAYSMSLESVVRTRFGDQSGALWRVVGSGEFEVARDAWLIASFGRDHESIRQGSLVAQFGLKFNFIRNRYDSGASRPVN